MDKKRIPRVKLLIPRSRTSTESHKTGAWRFATPLMEEKTAPCAAACPAGENIPLIEMMTSRGDVKAAWDAILTENPFPGICGHVCFHPCEAACNRSFLDEAVAIHQLERFIGETAITSGFSIGLTPLPSKGIRIAVVGAGPAGLSAAYFLTTLGYECSVFEKTGHPGGLMHWGIPRYRLPEWVLENEISRLREMGISIYCNHPIGPESLAHLKASFQGVFIGCGNGKPLRLGIPDESLIREGLSFLSEIREKGSTQIKGESVVIGGGNTAVDVARTLLRLGSRPLLVYRRRESDMPAFIDEIKAALGEGVRVMELLSPIRIEKVNERFRVWFQKMKVSHKTPGGRPRVFPDESAEPVYLEADSVFSGIGARPDEWSISESRGDFVLKMRHSTFYPSTVPVVCGGDLTNQIQSVADAVASGKEAAMAFDTYFLRGVDQIQERILKSRVSEEGPLSMAIYLGVRRNSNRNRSISFSDINSDYLSQSPRIVPMPVPWNSKNPDFSVREETYPAREGMNEASRCIHCGMCDDCDNCRLFCPDLCIEWDGRRQIQFDYCKGCGICVTECPRGVITFGETVS